MTLSRSLSLAQLSALISASFENECEGVNNIKTKKGNSGGGSELEVTKEPQPNVNCGAPQRR